MKTMILILAITTGIVSCSKEDTNNESNYETSVNQETFGKKEWMITSIYMNPAVLDINGDGIKDSEMISSLQKEERSKKIIFAPDGKVWEKRNSSTSPLQKGSWKSDARGKSLLWIQDDGRILIAKASDFSLNTMCFSYKNEKLEIKYTFQSE